MPRSSITLDLEGHLQRAFERQVGDGGTELLGWHIIGDGASTHYYDRYLLDLRLCRIPNHWRDHLRYELRKHRIIIDTLVFENSLTTAPERYDDLVTRLGCLLEFYSATEAPAFLSIEFKLAEKHEVTIFVTCDHSAVVADASSWT